MALYINGNKVSGGGGNSNMQELTQEEYDELTTEEKNNGTVYYITDVNGDGESFQPIIYSENEREIGVWIDGKPLYEKSVKILKSNISSGTNTVIHNISNFGDLADVFVTWIYNNGDCNYGTEINSDNSSYIKTVYDIGTSDFTLKIGSDAYSIISYILVTLRYTKSTDQAGSGTWTPQGVPAVHYSIDEQVVGVDEEGNTLYEKFYKVANVYSTNTIIDSTKTSSNTKIKGLIFGSFTIGGAYNNAQFCTPHISTNSDVRLFMNENGLSINAEGFDTSTYPITDCYFRIQYTKSSQGGN